MTIVGQPRLFTVLVRQFNIRGSFHLHRNFVTAAWDTSLQHSVKPCEFVARRISAQIRRPATPIHCKSYKNHLPTIPSRFSSQSVIMSLERDILPRAIKPINYDISLYDLELGGAFSFHGTVKLEVEIKDSTKEVVLNAHELQVLEASISIGDDASPQNHTKISYNEKAHRVHIEFSNALPQTPRAMLTIKYSGTMNNAMKGFYRSKYKPTVTPAASVAKDDEYHYMFSTQFEAAAARMAFPCFDEPNLKATFDVDIEIPEDQTVISNMPEKATRKGSKEGLKVVSFERTPIMSTYLLAWAFGDFEYVEDFTRRKYDGKPLPVRVYTTRGLKEQGQFALQITHQVIDYFSEVFRIDYPLPKADLLAVHEFSHGAMENWGLVTYRTTAVLFDEANSDQSYKNRVASIVAHELAHQWFGNLVTMDWWNELWLNEGFATWVGWFAIDHLYPEWNVWGRFVTEGYQTAFQLDSLRTSHPIEVPLRDVHQVEQVFDAISYLKGSSVIRMVSAYLGEDMFLLGVSDYLKAHSYGNATTKDLWSALSKRSGQDVNAFMDSWIQKIGFPVLTVTEEPGQVSVKQTRFLSTGDVKAEDDSTTWWIPLNLRNGSKTEKSAALSSKQETLRDIDDSFYKFNADQTGFYRTNYPPARLAKLGASQDKLSVEDKIGLIGDAGALAMSGESTSAALLTFLENFQSEQSFLVWHQIASSIGSLRSVFSENQAISAGLRKFALKLFTPSVDKIGWDFGANEDFLRGQLRALLIANAGLAGHPGVISEATKRFELYMTGKDSTAIHPSLRSAVFRIAITEGGKDAYETVKNWYSTNMSIDGKEIALQSMGRVQTKDLATEYFDFLMSDKVAVQDFHSGAAALAANSKTRATLWELIKKDWDLIRDGRIGKNSVVLERMLRVTLNQFASHEVEQDIEKFFADKDQTGYDRALGVIANSIKGRASYKQRDEALILEWLQAHGYA